MITENFIKMCGHAGEIQELWRNPFRAKYGDMYWKGDKYLMIPSACELCIVSNFIPEDEIWLPTQEQLQEMLHNYYQNNNSNAKGLEWGDSINEYMLNQLLNFEKDNREIVYDLNSLWLAFVMHELYNKIWTGEKWEEIIC